MTRRARIALYLVPLAVFALLPVLVQGAILAPFGWPVASVLPDYVFLLSASAFVAALSYSILSLPLLAFARTRKLIGALPVIAVMTLIGTVLGFVSENAYRTYAFRRLSVRSKPLIAAVQQFVAERGVPPPDLSSLVPGYLAAVPRTGMGAYPEYRLVSDEGVQKDTGNRWILMVDTPSGAINWDVFVYYPNQRYPETGFDGVLERIGDWAYVHE
ncbi:MAG TPA: hypothetical protein VNA69_10080 [Thermoanaerobaculia bacterium]|nr:hypothetical protein [Thermoanaerobaculia bacterium]